MTTSEKYEDYEESSSFVANLRRNLNVVTINEYAMLVLAGFSILLLSGLIFVLAKTPDVFLSTPGSNRVIYIQFPPQGQKYNGQGLQYEYVLEMFIVAGTIALGAIGLYLMKNATAYIDDQRRALSILIIGTLVFIFAVLLLFFIYLYKMTGNFPSFAGLGS